MRFILNCFLMGLFGLMFYEVSTLPTFVVVVVVALALPFVIEGLMKRPNILSQTYGRWHRPRTISKLNQEKAA